MSYVYPNSFGRCVVYKISPFLEKYLRFLEYLKTTVVGADSENSGRVAETEREKIGGPCDGLVDGVVDGVDACRIACFLAHA